MRDSRLKDFNSTPKSTLQFQGNTLDCVSGAALHALHLILQNSLKYHILTEATHLIELYIGLFFPPVFNSVVFKGFELYQIYWGLQVSRSCRNRKDHFACQMERLIPNESLSGSSSTGQVNLHLGVLQTSRGTEWLFLISIKGKAVFAEIRGTFCQKPEANPLPFNGLSGVTLRVNSHAD